MIPLSSLLFFYTMLLFLIPAIILGLLGKSIHGYGLFFTICMLIIVFGENGQLLTLLLYYVWQTGLCFIYLKIKKKTGCIFPVWILLAIFPLIFVKIGETNLSVELFQLLGISYMTFRSVQIILDIHDGKIKELKLFDFTYFLLFFPAVSSGPIDRYERFKKDLDYKLNQQEYIDILRLGICRILSGAFGAFVIAGVIQNFWLSKIPETGILATLSYMYGYALFLFFNFSGYSSMAIGTSYILGIRLPENFNMPFLSLDMKDFWSRWHMSLYTWLRDHVYNRFVRSSIKKKRFKNPRTASYIGYMLNMLIMGLWHGIAFSFILYGIYHGLLLCMNEGLDLHSKSFRKLKKNPWGQLLLVFVTFNLFSFGLLIFTNRLFI